MIESAKYKDLKQFFIGVISIASLVAAIIGGSQLYWLLHGFNIHPSAFIAFMITFSTLIGAIHATEKLEIKWNLKTRSAMDEERK